jgi:prolipoprotein diacylglyceryl transferase
MTNGFEWKFDPTMLNVFGLDIRWYGLMWALAIAIGTLFFIQFVRREGLPGKVSDSIFLYGVIATVLGARLGHCLFYNPGYYLADPVQFLNFRDGGLASHGAAVGLLIGLWLFSKRNKLAYTWSLDRIMIPVAVGGALVRLGNLFNHEIYGGPTDAAWGFRFIENLGAWMKGAEPVFGPASHPTQIYEALCYLILFGILCWLYYGKDMARRRPGLMFGVALIGVFLARFVIEFVKNVQEPFELKMIDTFGINMGQALSIPFIIAGILMVVYGMKHKTTPPPLVDTSFWPKAKPEVKKGKKR